MLKYRESHNGKSVIPVCGNRSSSMMTIPIRIAKKYKLYHSDITYEERGDGGLFIKKGNISCHDSYLHDRQKEKLWSDYSRISGKKI